MAEVEWDTLLRRSPVNHQGRAQRARRQAPHRRPEPRCGLILRQGPFLLHGSALGVQDLVHLAASEEVLRTGVLQFAERLAVLAVLALHRDLVALLDVQERLNGDEELVLPRSPRRCESTRIHGGLLPHTP
eukprot:3028490-Rhodomonas_salina.1